MNLALSAAAGDGGRNLVRLKAGGAPKLAEVERVRSLFPETWIWLDFNARYVESDACLIYSLLVSCI